MIHDPEEKVFSKKKQQDRWTYYFRETVAVLIGLVQVQDRQNPSSEKAKWTVCRQLAFTVHLALKGISLSKPSFQDSVLYQGEGINRAVTHMN